jgi:hypothetical protein
MEKMQTAPQTCTSRIYIEHIEHNLYPKMDIFTGHTPSGQTLVSPTNGESRLAKFLQLSEKVAKVSPK